MIHDYFCRQQEIRSPLILDFLGTGILLTQLWGNCDCDNKFLAHYFLQLHNAKCHLAWIPQLVTSCIPPAQALAIPSTCARFESIVQVLTQVSANVLYLPLLKQLALLAAAGGTNK